MSSFTTPLVVTPLANGRDWKIVSPFVYYSELSQPAEGLAGADGVEVRLDGPQIPSSGCGLRTYITIPPGFVTDFASVPRCVWWLVSPTGKHGKAAVVHDFLYRNGIGNRKWADDVFYEAMKVLGVPWWKRKLMYRAVRWFGKKAFIDG